MYCGIMTTSRAAVTDSNFRGVETNKTDASMVFREVESSPLAAWLKYQSINLEYWSVPLAKQLDYRR